MSKEIPKMPKEGLMLPFFDKPEDIPAVMCWKALFDAGIGLYLG